MSFSNNLSQINFLYHLSEPGTTVKSLQIEDELSDSNVSIWETIEQVSDDELDVVTATELGTETETVTEILDEYDEVGKLIQTEYVYDDDGNIKSQIEYYYDKNDNLKTVCVYDGDGNVKSQIEYDYDENGNLKTRCTYDSDGNIESKYEYSYDENGNKVEQTYSKYNNGNIILESKNNYDENGLIIGETLTNYDDDGNIESKLEYSFDDEEKITGCTEYEYDDDENIESKIEYRYEEGKITGHTEYKYDENGNIISETCYDEDGDIAANGEIDEDSSQGSIGDCWLLAAIESIASTPEGLEILNDSIEVLDDGSVSVTLKGVGITYTISAEELSDTDNYSSGDLDVRAIEIAMEKYLEDYGYTTDGGKEYNTIENGGLSNWAFEILTGADAEYTWGNIDFDEILEELQENPNYVCVVAATSGQDVEYSATNENGEEVTISTKHAYSVTGVDDEYVYLVNPWDTSETLKMTIDEFKETFNQIYTADLSEEAADNSNEDENASLFKKIGKTIKNFFSNLFS